MLSSLRTRASTTLKLGLGNVCSRISMVFDENSREHFTTMADSDTSSYHRSQVDQLDDRCILVDENDRITGTATKKECHLAIDAVNSPGGLLHRAFSVFLFNTKNELLVQQRSSKKITFPGYYTNSCCSHPRANELEMSEKDHLGIKVAAQRRMQFELGIPEYQLPIEDIHYLTKIHYNAPAGPGWAENELDHVVFIKRDVDLHPNLDEVEDVRFVNQQSLQEFIIKAEEQGLLITPWFKYIYATFLQKWWKQLSEDTSSLAALKDEKIWRAGSIM